jgi:hypothetical protein
MNTGLWNLDSGLAAARRPGMTPQVRGVYEPPGWKKLRATAGRAASGG